MEALNDQLNTALAKCDDAKKKLTTFQDELKQVTHLEDKLTALVNKNVAVQWKNIKTLRCVVSLTETHKFLLKELDEVQAACHVYEDYDEQLGDEVRAAEGEVARVKRAIERFEIGGDGSIDDDVRKSRLEVACEAREAVVKDYGKIVEVGWSGVFPALWARCGWSECRRMKSSLRKQFLCPHLVARHFLHLDVDELEEEKKRWHPDNFANVERKFRELAEELVGDIEQIIERRLGGESYLWQQKERQIFPGDDAIDISTD